MPPAADPAVHARLLEAVRQIQALPTGLTPEAALAACAGAVDSAIDSAIGAAVADSASETRLVRRIAALCAAEADIATFLQGALAEMVASLGAGGGSIYRIDGDWLRLVAHVDSGKRNLAPAIRPLERLPLQGTFSASLLQSEGAREWRLDQVPPPVRAALEHFGVRVVASTPIAAAGVQLGLLHATRYEARSFTADELDRLGSAGTQIGAGLAAALRRDESDTELEHRRVEMYLLNRVADGLGRTLNLDQVIDLCLDFGEEMAGAVGVALELLNEAETHFEIVGTRRVALTPEFARTPIADSLYARYHGAQHGPVLFRISDERMTPAVAAELLRHGMQAMLLVPLLVNDRLIGVKAIGLAVDRPIPRLTLDTLLAIGEQEAVAIDRARLYQVAELRAQLAAALRETAERVIEQGPDAVGEALLAGLSRICRTSLGRLAVFDRDGRSVTVACQGYDPDRLARAEAEWGDDAGWRRLQQLTMPTLIERATNGSSAGDDATASQVLLPLRLGGRVVGLLEAPSDQARRFHPEEIAAMSLLGALAVSAIESQRLHHAAAAEQRLLRRVIDRIPFPIAVIDAGLRFEQVNTAYRTLTSMPGRPGGSLLEELGLLRLSRSDGNPVAHEELSVVRALRGEEPAPVERILLTPSGARTTYVHAVPLADDTGAVSRALIALQDVTALRELADAKDRFLAVASHELRSPLASLSACASLLEIDPRALADPERRGQLTSRIKAHVRRLARLVDDLVDTARARSGSMSLRPLPAELGAIAQEAIEVAQQDAAAEPASRSLPATPHLIRVDAPERVHGSWDKERLAQVVQNLLANAQRYSAPGSEIVVAVRREGERALLSVRDQGIGVPPLQQRAIFEPFVRGAEASQWAPQGLGLGLFITAEIVRQHGGTIGVESTPGAGAVFTVDLPLQAPEP